MTSRTRSPHPRSVAGEEAAICAGPPRAHVSVRMIEGSLVCNSRAPSIARGLSSCPEARSLEISSISLVAMICPTCAEAADNQLSPQGHCSSDNSPGSPCDCQHMPVGARVARTD